MQSILEPSKGVVSSMWRPLKMDNSARFFYLRPEVWLFSFLPVNLARALALFSSQILWHFVFHFFLFQQIQLNPALSFQNSKVSLASCSLVMFWMQLVQSEHHSSLHFQPHFPAEYFSWHCLNSVSMGLMIHCFCPYSFCGSRKTGTNGTCTSYLRDLLRDWEQAAYS